MTDEKLLQLNKYLIAEDRAKLDDAKQRRKIGGAEIAINTIAVKNGAGKGSRRADLKRIASKRTDIFLLTLSAEELNDLRAIIGIGSYSAHNKKDSRGLRSKLSVNDYAAWRQNLGIRKLSHDESIAELRTKSRDDIVENIREYLKVRPMSNTRRNMIRIKNAKQDGVLS